MWNQLSVEQKQNYGEDYFERAMRSLEKYTEKVCAISQTISTNKSNVFIYYLFIGC